MRKSGERLRVLEMGPSGRVFYAPDGARFAAVEYGTPEQPEGVLTLYAADGGAGRTVARFPAAPGRARLSGAGAVASRWERAAVCGPAGRSRHRAWRSIGKVQTAMRNSSAMSRRSRRPGRRTAPGWRIFNPLQAPPNVRDLVLAEPNGANPQPYAQLQGGGFLGWSPYGQEFLYLSDNNVYAGAPDRAPELLGNSISVYDPHWVASRSTALSCSIRAQAGCSSGATWAAETPAAWRRCPKIFLTIT